MRLLAIGDIHGCAAALETLLDHIELRPGDTVITLGDYINKGPDSRAVLDILIKLYNQDLLIPLTGNHELKLVEAKQKGRVQVGSKVLVDRKTLTSYGIRSSKDLSCIPEAHWQFMQSHCRKYVETEDYIFVHATLQPDKPLSKQSDRALFWDKLYNPKPHVSGKTVICGHTPQKDGKPLNLGHTIGIDTAAWQGRWLTCLDVRSGQVWQANQSGKIQASHIDDYLGMSEYPKGVKSLISYLRQSLRVR